MDPPAAPPSADWRRALRVAVYAFLLSRLIVLGAGALAVAHAGQWPAGGSDPPSLRLSSEVFATLGARAMANDAGWYHGIVRDGYTVRPFDTTRQENWAFFPLQPLLWRAATGLGLAPLPAGLMLANGLFLFGLFQAHRWGQLIADVDIADRLVLVVAFFPAAYFFSMPLTEPLFLALVASSLLAMERGRWGGAATVAALASGTRVVGVALAGVLWLRGHADPALPPWRRWALTAFATTGLAAFMVFLWRICGNPLAFADIQTAWGRDRGSLLRPFEQWWADPAMIASWWTVHPLANACALFGVVASVVLWRRGQRALALFSLFSTLLPWSSGSMLGMPRYLAVCLPALLVLALWLRRPAALLAWLLAASATLAWLSAAFFLGAWYAGA